jgi:two-component system, NarL family, sensor histidine kinase DegS
MFAREFITKRNPRPLWKNFHFWAIISISVVLILIYLTWPWRDYNFNPGLWQRMTWLAPLYQIAVFEIKYHAIGILGLVPVIYASVVFKWRGSLIGSVLLLIYLFPLIHRIWNDFNSQFFNVVLLLLPVSIVTAIKIELELRRKDREIYIQREQEYQIYLTKILETQEQERRRLAEDLHDGSVQTLLAVASYAESVEISDDNIAEMKIKAAWIKEKTRGAVDELRRISIDLRPGVLDDMGLIPALKWLTNQSNKMGKMRVHLTVNIFKPALPPEVEVNIFRIAQEALHNIEKHAKATEANINIDTDTESLIITIRDNGQGFVPPHKFGSLVSKGKLGLIGIQERAKSLGGTFEIQSAPTEGTILSIRVPVQSLPKSPIIPLDNSIPARLDARLTDAWAGDKFETLDQ